MHVKTQKDVNEAYRQANLVDNTLYSFEYRHT